MIERITCIYSSRCQNQEDVINKPDEGSCDDDYDSIGDYDTDEDEIEEEEKMRMRENALTMNKMAELKRQLQNLSMTRKNKQVYTKNKLLPVLMINF